MKVRLPQRLPRRAGGQPGNVNVQAPGWSRIVVILFAALLCHASAFGAGPVKGPTAQDGEKATQSYAPIGDSGYRVPIPEIHMNRVFGGQRREQPHTDNEKAEPAPGPGPVERPQPAPAETPQVQETPHVQWLPFDPSRRTPTLRQPQKPMTPEDVPPKEEIPRMLRPPAAPDKPLEAIPPKKELMGAVPPPPLPIVLAAPRVKDAPKPKHAKFNVPAETDADGVSIALDTRQEPSVVALPKPPPETEPARSVASLRPEDKAGQQIPEPRAKTPPEPERVAVPEAKPEPKPEPIPEPVKTPEARPKPAPEPKRVEIPKPEPKPEPILEPVKVPEPRPEPVPEPKRVEIPKPEPKPEPILEPVKVPEPRPEPVPEPKRVEIPKPEPKPEPIPEPVKIPEPRPKPAPEPKRVEMPKPEPKPEPIPEPVKVPEPRPKPAPEPKRVEIPKPEPKPEPILEPVKAPEARPEPAPEPKRVEIPKPEPKPEPIPEPVKVPEARPEPAPEPKREPVTEPQPVPAPSEIAKVPAPGPPEEPTATKPPAEEIPPHKEEPPPPPKPVVPSPLDDKNAASAELRDYLRDTAPILEELSLLMTRAPSLALTDYDPSQERPKAFRDDIYMKIEYMKRELQVLDSKTFAIIPPKKYKEFHSVIRESILETYQACDTIMAFMRDPNGQNLQKMQEHLRKARELIQMTRAGRMSAKH